eukprot:g4635.t1
MGAAASLESPPRSSSSSSSFSRNPSLQSKKKFDFSSRSMGRDSAAFYNSDSRHPLHVQGRCGCYTNVSGTTCLLKESQLRRLTKKLAYEIAKGGRREKISVTPRIVRMEASETSGMVTFRELDKVKEGRRARDPRSSETGRPVAGFIRYVNIRSIAKGPPSLNLPLAGVRKALENRHIFSVATKEQPSKWLVVEVATLDRLEEWVVKLRHFAFGQALPANLAPARSSRPRRGDGRSAPWSPAEGGDMVTTGLWTRLQEAARFDDTQALLQYTGAAAHMDRHSSSRGGQMMDTARTMLGAASRQGTSLALVAAQNGSVRTLQMLIKQAHKLDTVTGNSGRASAAMLLMGPNLRGENPIFAAAAGGHVECLEWLLMSQAMHRAAENASEVISTGLVRNVDGATVLHVAASKGQVGVVAFFCEFGIDMLDAVDVNGETPCHAAARSGNADCLQLLLETAADPNVKNRKGETALTIARKKSRRKSSKCENILLAFDAFDGMDMSRIMEVWNTFFENALKASIHEPGSQKSSAEVTELLAVPSLPTFSSAAQPSTVPSLPSFSSLPSSLFTPPFSHAPEIEEEWVLYYDAEADCSYWYNEATGESEWQYRDEGASFSGAAGHNNDEWSPPAMWAWGEEWQRLRDEGTGHEYFYNELTGESQWAENSNPEAEFRDDGEAEFRDDWELLHDAESGCSYWHNRETGESSWQAAPDDSQEDWELLVDEATGYEYWRNVETGDCEWCEYEVLE